MAIQTRRGTYNDFDPEKLLPGEWATVQSDDPHSADGKSMYMCFAPGEVKRMATYEDMVQNIDSAVEEIKDQFSAGMQQATDAANTAAGSAAESASAATTAADRANEAVQAIEEAVQGTIINDASPSELTVYSSQKIESKFRKESEIVDISHGGTGETNLSDAITAMMEAITPESVTNFATGISPASTGGGLGSAKVQVRKIGKIVFLEGSVTVENFAGEYLTLCTLPSGYAPAGTIVFYATLTGARMARFQIASSGVITLNWVYNADGTEYTGPITWLQLNSMWLV